MQQPANGTPDQWGNTKQPQLVECRAADQKRWPDEIGNCHTRNTKGQAEASDRNGIRNVNAAACKNGRTDPEKDHNKCADGVGDILSRDELPKTVMS